MCNLRFEKRIYIPLPDYKGRLALLHNRLKDTPSSLKENEVEELVNMLEGYNSIRLIKDILVLI